MNYQIPLEEIIEKAEIVEYINVFYPDVHLIRSGGWYKGYCPFHADDKPSFGIRVNTKTYKCFGCGEYGNIINFVMKMENLDFKEACKLVGDNIGVEVTLEPPNPYFEKYKTTFQNYAERYHKNLLNNEVALKYLMETRGLTIDTINDFNLGLTYPDEYKYRTEFPLGRINGRITYPIYENKNIKIAKVVGMGYGSMIGENPKYINDINQEGRSAVIENDTMIKPAQDPNLKGVFIKGNCFYGYHNAYEAIKELNYSIVVEGYHDVLSMHQSGIKNTVGILSTSFTDYQMDILKSLSSNIMLLYDGDSAGKKNMFEDIEKLYDKDFNVILVLLDMGKDPDLLCKKLKFNVKEVMSYIHKNQKPAALALIDKETNIYENIVTKERIRVLHAVSPILNKIKDNSTKTVYFDKLYKKLEMK